VDADRVQRSRKAGGQAIDGRIPTTATTAIALGRQLAKLGYTTPASAPAPDTGTAPIQPPTEWKDLLDAACRLIQWYGQVVGTNPLQQAQGILDQPRCGCPDVMAAGQGLCQWSHAPVTVAQSISLTQYATNIVADCWAAALETWEAACGISFQYAARNTVANITARSGAIDGPGRTLAWSHLPCGANETTALSQLYDSSEVWPSRAYLTATMIHELGHALGLDHSQDPLNIMFPSMRPNVMALGPGDIAQAQARYGQPRQQPTPTPQPIPTPTPNGNPILTIDGRRFEVAGRWL
jgi:hypothetical protein